MADELIDIFDENNKPLNIQKMKSEAHANGLWHRVVHVWIYNSKKELLIQLRAKDKDMHPNEWDISSAGHVSAGEEVIDGAMRELDEELGLKIQKKDLRFLKVKKNSSDFGNMKNNEFYNVYLLQYEGDITKLKIQKEELQKIRFIKLDELAKDLKFKINSKKYVNRGDYWFEMIEEIKKAK
jgi:isopentenyl-diphosphate Delta-isomerase